jgi:hypothetical protein
MLRIVLGLAAVLVPVQLLFGHLVGDAVHDKQPSKFAAIEARWHDESAAAEVLLAWPNETTEANEFAIAIPYLGSVIASMSLTSNEVGLTDWPKSDRPPVAIRFFAFRLMVGCGLLMLGLAWYGSLQLGVDASSSSAGCCGRCSYPSPSASSRRLPGGSPRSWPPALGRVRPAAHRASRDPVPDYGGSLRHARAILGRLHPDLLVWHLVYLPAPPAWSRVSPGSAGGLHQPEASALDPRRQYRRQPDIAPDVAGVGLVIEFWTAVVALTIFLYVTLDGFDLGIGMLLLLAPDERSRLTMLESIAPVWTATRPGSCST